MVTTFPWIRISCMPCNIMHLVSLSHEHIIWCRILNTIFTPSTSLLTLLSHSMILRLIVIQLTRLIFISRWWSEVPCKPSHRPPTPIPSECKWVLTNPLKLCYSWAHSTRLLLKQAACAATFLMAHEQPAEIKWCRAHWLAINQARRWHILMSTNMS